MHFPVHRQSCDQQPCLTQSLIFLLLNPLNSPIYWHFFKKVLLPLKKILSCCPCFQLSAAKLPLSPAEFVSKEALQKTRRIPPQSAGPAGCRRCSPNWPGKSCGTVHFSWPRSRGKAEGQMDERAGKGAVWFERFPKLHNKILRGGCGNTSSPARRDGPASLDVPGITAGLQSVLGGGAGFPAFTPSILALMSFLHFPPALHRGTGRRLVQPPWDRAVVVLTTLHRTFTSQCLLLEKKSQAAILVSPRNHHQLLVLPGAKENLEGGCTPTLGIRGLWPVRPGLVWCHCTTAVQDGTGRMSADGDLNTLPDFGVEK